MFYKISFTRRFWNVYRDKLTKKALKKPLSPTVQTAIPSNRGIMDIPVQVMKCVYLKTSIGIFSVIKHDSLLSKGQQMVYYSGISDCNSLKNNLKKKV